MDAVGEVDDVAVVAVGAGPPQRPVGDGPLVASAGNGPDAAIDFEGDG